MNMKKLLYLFAALALLWGCDKNKEQAQPGTEDNNIVTEIGELPEVLYVSTAAEADDVEKESVESRTYTDDKRVLWQNGDAISFFAGNIHNVKYFYEGEDGLASVELVKDEASTGISGDPLMMSQAVYPYNEATTVTYNETKGIYEIQLTYPTTQKYGEKSFGKEANIMVAAGEHSFDDQLYFRNACGYLVIKLYGIGTNDKPTVVKSISLSSVSGVDKIAGSAIVVANSEEAPVITMADDASTSVTMDCSNDGRGVELGADAEHATEFWFCLPPVTFTGGIKITVTDVYDNAYTKQTTNTVNIVRNDIQPMAALEFKSNAPAATKLWYTRKEGVQTPLTFYGDEDDAEDQNPFDAQITGHGWDNSVGKIVITFDRPLTTIKQEAFRDTDIETITLPEGFTTIEEGAFRNSPLKEITIPGSMTNIGLNVFYDCASLESVTFLPSPTKTPLNICHMSDGYQWGPFADSRLTTINLNRELNYVDSDGDKFTPSDDDEGLFYHENWEQVNRVNVTIGPQVNTLLYKMFQHLPIESLTIPGTVTTIENNVFEDCQKLVYLVFEPSVDGSALTMGYDDSGNHEGPFIDSPLETVKLNREINYTFPASSIDDDLEGLFGGKTSLRNIELGEQVKTLSNNMFADASITEIVIPGSVNSIGCDVFHECYSLAEVTFAASPTGEVLAVGYDTYGEDENLFQDSSLTTLKLNREIKYASFSETVNTPSEGLFGDLSNLTNITLGEQVKTLSVWMFANTPIESIIIPGTVTHIDNDVFSQCENLKNVTFEPSTTGAILNVGYSVDGGLFAGSPLEIVKLDREVNYLFPSDKLDEPIEGLFGNKENLTSVVLGDNVKTLSPYMFAKSGLTTLNLNKVETIGDYALMNLGLTSLTVPGIVNTIGRGVFAECDKLEEITFEPSSEGKELAIDFGSTSGPFYDCPLKIVNLNREVKYPTPGQPSQGMFGIKKDLTTVTLGDQVKTILPYMFADSGIKSLDLNKVETIDDYALIYLDFTSLVVPESVKTIGNNVFIGCNSLASLEFKPNSNGEALIIGFQSGTEERGPFYQSPLNKVVLNREIVPSEEYALACNQSHEGIFANEHSKESLEEGQSAPTVQILSNVNTLYPYMFSGWGMTDLEIPECVAEVKDNAFYDCFRLENLTFLDSDDDLIVGFQPGTNQRGPFYQSPLTNIVVNRSLVLSESYDDACDSRDEGIFSTKHGSQNTTISLGGQVAKLPKYMLSSLPVETLTIPGTVTEIGNNVFENCTKLTSITFEPNDENKPLTMGYYVGTSDDYGPFCDCPLKTVNFNREINYTFPNPTEEDDGVFGYREQLTTVNLGKQVKTLLPYMFARTLISTLDLNASSVVRLEKGALSGSALTEIRIPLAINYIGDDVFKNCTSLEKVVFMNCIHELTIGYQPGTNEHGPFYQSPLKEIWVGRGLVLTDAYADACDANDEGIFSTQYGSQDVKISLGSEVTTIPEFMFSKLPITEITIPANVREIGNDAFNECTNLKSVKFERSDNVITLGYNTTGDDEGLFVDSPLESVVLNRPVNYTFPNPAKAIEGLFGGKPSLVSANIHEKEKTLSPYMFAGSGLTSFDLKNVETIGNGALMGADFESISIPATTTFIGDYAFAECESLSDLTFADGESELTIGFQPNNNERGPFYHSPLRDIYVGRGILFTEAYSSACNQSDEGIFATKHDIQDTSVSLGQKVTRIPKFMFSNLPITSITIPRRVSEIGENAFANCQKLAEVVFEEGWTSDTPTIIRSQSGKVGPFNQSPLSKIEIGTYRKLNYVDSDGNPFTPSTHNQGLFAAGSTKADKVEVSIGEWAIDTISEYMFANSNVESITIPFSVNNIKQNAFINCDKLSSVEFPTSPYAITVSTQYASSQNWGPFYDSPLSNIYVGRDINYVDGNGNAFTPTEFNDGFFANEDCGSVENVVVNLENKYTNIKSISPFMFAGLKMSSISIPATVTEIGNDAFNECTKLASVTFEASATAVQTTPIKVGYNTAGDHDGLFVDAPLTTVVLGREINYTFPNPNTNYEGLFGGKSQLTSVTLGDNVKTLLDYMFAGAPVKNLNLNKVQTIGKYALSGTGLNAITIPGSVNTIKGYAFSECSSLSSLRFESGATPLTIGFQLGSWDDAGPFYQSPLSYIFLDRDLVMDDEYKEDGDGSDEGVFSNKYYDDDSQPITKLIIGNNVTTILPYMFARTRIQQLHIPERVMTIGTQVVEDCEVLNAIVFYNKTARANVADYAFGKSSVLDDLQYFIFVPLRTKDRNEYSTYYSSTRDRGTYWEELYAVMVDDWEKDVHQPHVCDGRDMYKRYIVDDIAYEWYKIRYHQEWTIQPPTE